MNKLKRRSQTVQSRSKHSNEQIKVQAEFEDIASHLDLDAKLDLLESLDAEYKRQAALQRCNHI